MSDLMNKLLSSATWKSKRRFCLATSMLLREKTPMVLTASILISASRSRIDGITSSSKTVCRVAFRVLMAGSCKSW